MKSGLIRATFWQNMCRRRIRSTSKKPTSYQRESTEEEVKDSRAVLDNSEFLVWNSFKANKNKPQKDQVIVEYKYSLLTTLCCGEVMKKRRELIVKKQSKNEYVKFPAILMTRKDGEENYSVVQDISNFSVNYLCLSVSVCFILKEC